MPSGLVLESESEQWVLYTLDKEDKVESAYFPGSLERALIYAKHHFGVEPAEWIEDSPN